MYEQEVKSGNFRFVVRNTAAAMMTYFVWLDAWKIEDGDPESAWKANFMLAASHTVEHEGLNGWKVPPRQASAKQLENAYAKLMAELPFEVMREWHRAADATHQSPANEVEKPDKALSESESADPN